MIDFNIYKEYFKKEKDFTPRQIENGIDNFNWTDYIDGSKEERYNIIDNVLDYNDAYIFRKFYLKRN